MGYPNSLDIGEKVTTRAQSVHLIRCSQLAEEKSSPDRLTAAWGRQLPSLPYKQFKLDLEVEDPCTEL
jgi:hypothetical protein